MTISARTGAAGRRATLRGLLLVDRHRHPRTPLSADTLILAFDAALGGLAGDERLPEGRRRREPPAGCPVRPWRA